MFNIWLDYPSFEEELEVVKNTTAPREVKLNTVMTGEEILYFQQLIRKVPVADNVLQYAVGVTAKTRPGTPAATEEVNKYISWGAGPRASQYLVLASKCHALLAGKYSPDIEDVKAVAIPIFRHRIARNYKAEAEGYTLEKLITGLL